MRLSITILVFMFSLLESFAQMPSWAWAKSAGNAGSNDNAMAYAVCTDGTGNIYSTGSFDGDSIAFGNFTLINPGGLTMFLVKYDSNGDVLWAKSAGNYGYVEGYSVTTDNSNNVYVAGCFFDTLLTLGSITLINSHDSIGHSDMFIVKFDSSGNVIWAINEGGRYSDQAFSINADNNGNVFVSGIFTSDSLFIGSTLLLNTDTLTACHCHVNMFVSKYDSSGNPIWAQRGGPIALVAQYPSTIDELGNVYIAGSFNYPSMIVDTVTIYNSSSPTYTDMFIVKYDSNGNFLWAESSTGNHGENAKSIIADSNGNTYVVGEFGLLSHSFGSITLNNAGGQDAFIVKYDGSGNVIWAQSFGDTHNDVANSVICDATGNVYFSGYFGSPLVTIGSFVLQNPGLLIAKLDSSGGVIWAMEPTGGILKNSLATDALSNLYIAGSYYTTTVNFGSYVLTSAGGFEDMYIAKLGSTVGINEINNENSLLIFPNPTNNNFTIILPPTTKKIQISNSLGQLIQTKIVDRETNLSVSLADNGIYFIHITTEKQRITKKVTVCK